MGLLLWKGLESIGGQPKESGTKKAPFKEGAKE